MLLYRFILKVLEFFFIFRRIFLNRSRRGDIIIKGNPEGEAGVNPGPGYLGNLTI